MGYQSCCPPPACWVPVMLVPAWPQPLVREVEVAASTTATSANGLVGGAAPVRLTLEYLIAPGAAAPAIGIKVVTGTQTANWSATALTPGYQTLEPLGPVAAGSQVTLTATDALARLRWCETICC